MLIFSRTPSLSLLVDDRWMPPSLLQPSLSSSSLSTGCSDTSTRTAWRWINSAEVAEVRKTTRFRPANGKKAIWLPSACSDSHAQKSSYVRTSLPQARRRVLNTVGKTQQGTTANGLPNRPAAATRASVASSECSPTSMEQSRSRARPSEVSSKEASSRARKCR